MELLHLISASKELGALIEKYADTTEEDAIAIVESVVTTLQHSIGKISYIEKVKMALSDYLSNRLLNINDAAKKYGVDVGDLRVEFAKHLEEKYSA